MMLSRQGEVKPEGSILHVDYLLVTMEGMPRNFVVGSRLLGKGIVAGEDSGCQVLTLVNLAASLVQFKSESVVVQCTLECRGIFSVWFGQV